MISFNGATGGWIYTGPFSGLITDYNEGPADQEQTFPVEANLDIDILPGASDPLGAGRLAQRALFLHRDQS